MASLAETSVVIALRDWQWMHRMAQDQFPDRYLALAGNAEKKLGDAAIRHDERLFLFELKGTRSSITDEWKLLHLEDGSTMPRKSAHRWALGLRDLLQKQGTSSAAVRQLLIPSLQAHHFVYWTADLMQGVPPYGHLQLESYFSGTAKLHADPNWKRAGQSVAKAFPLATVRPSRSDDAPGSIRCQLEKGVLPLDAIHDRCGRLIELNNRIAHPYIWRYLGLQLPEFQVYVDTLCGGVERAESINVVILSDGGSFFAHLTSTDQLKTIFEAPVPRDRIQQQVESNAIDTDWPMAEPADSIDPRPRPSGP